MSPSWFFRVFSKPTKSLRRQRRAVCSAGRTSFRPRLEALEDRMLLSAPSAPPIFPVSSANATTMGNGPSSIAADSSNMPSANPEAVSANGQYAVFTSAATDLVNGVTVNNGHDNVYVRNLTTKTTSLVDVNSNGAVAIDGASQPVLTSDGRYVAFVSISSDLPGNSNGGEEVFVRDMQQGQTYLVSLGVDGNPANAAAQTPTIAETNNGQLVIAYQSAATNLSAGDTNDSKYQIFVATLKLDSNGNIQANTLSTKLVSADSSGNGANADSFDPVLSKDGSTLAFGSYASNLPNESAESLGHFQIFAYNVAKGTPLIQVSPAAGAGGVEDSSYISLSDNGQYIAYLNSSSDAKGNSSGQVLVWNAQTGSNSIIAQTGASSSFTNLTEPVISGDGSTVAFEGSKNPAFLQPDIYVASNGPSGGSSPTQVTDDSNRNEGTDASLPALSYNGQILAYVWDNIDSVTNPDLYVSNLSTGGRADVGSFGYNAALDANPPLSVSADGSTVIFHSSATNLVAGVSVPADSSGSPFKNVYYDVVGANHYTFSAPSSVTAGTSFQVTLTAADVNNNPVSGDNGVTGYNGTVHLSVRLAVVPAAATAVPLTGSNPVAEFPTTATFVNGVATITVTPMQIGQINISVTDAGNPILTSISSSITVNPLPTSVTKVSATPSSVFNNTNNAVTVQATITSSNGTVNEGSVVFALGAANGPMMTSSPVSVGSDGKVSTTLTLPSGSLPGSYNLTINYADPGGIFAGVSTTANNVLTVRTHEVPPPPPSPPVKPPVLQLIEGVLAGLGGIVTQMVNANGTQTTTDTVFGFPLLLATFDSSGHFVDATLFGLDITFLIELL